MQLSVQQRQREAIQFPFSEHPLRERGLLTGGEGSECKGRTVRKGEEGGMGHSEPSAAKAVGGRQRWSARQLLPLGDTPRGGEEAELLH